eukprot:6441514-Lingulodinium_polyedra.AAC.1
MRSAGGDGLKVPCYHKVQLDVGANEIIRPYNHQWWARVKYGKSKGTAVNMKIAGNSAHGAMMTARG